MLRHPEVSQPRQWVLSPTWHGRFESNAITARIMSKDNFVLGNQHDSHRSNAMTVRLCPRTTSCLRISTTHIEVKVPHWAACNRWGLLAYYLRCRSNFVLWVPLWGGGDSRKKARVLVVIQGRQSLTWTILSLPRPMTRPPCYTSNRLLVRSVWIGLTLGLAVAVGSYTDSGRGLLLLTCGVPHIELYVGLVSALPLSKLNWHREPPLRLTR